jgi:hypothetical protein
VLQSECRTQCTAGTRELNERTIAEEFCQAAAKTLYLGVHQILKQVHEPESSVFVFCGKRRVADNVSEADRSEMAGGIFHVRTRRSK